MDKDFPGLELSLTKLSPDPLPYQSIRVRLTLRNSGTRFLGGLDDSGFEFRRIRPPSEELRDLPFCDWAGAHQHGAGVISGPGGLVGEIQPTFRLGPGETESISGAITAGEDGRPVFEPGKYGLAASFLPDSAKTDDAIWAKPITFVVKVPVGDDAAVYKLLNENGSLARQMMAACTIDMKLRQRGAIPVLPTEATLHDLESVVGKFPRSSYADYARFALARAYLGGVQKARNAPAEQKAKALPLLEAIDLKTFPYAATVLLWIKIVKNNPADSRRIDARLEAEFGDDRAWVMAKMIPLGMKWQDELRPDDKWSERSDRKPEPTLYGDAEEMVRFIGGTIDVVSPEQIEELRKKVGRERGPRNWKPPADSK